MDAGRRVTHASGSHLLVVDDDRETRELLSLYLGQQGFDVAVVEDGPAMDAWLADNSTDLVILDLMLPGIDGLSVLRNIRIEDTVLFEPDSAQISSDFEPLLNQGLALLTIRPAATFVVIGHTDSLSGENYNLELSQRRADSVRDWLVESGIAEDRLSTRAFGPTRPAASNDTDAGRQTPAVELVRRGGDEGHLVTARDGVFHHWRTDEPGPAEDEDRKLVPRRGGERSWPEH